MLDGSEVYRLTYEELFCMIGTKYGAGDGFHTFNLHDFSGRVVVGEDHAEKRVKGIQHVGMSGGQASHLLSKGQLPSYSYGKRLCRSLSQVLIVTVLMIRGMIMVDRLARAGAITADGE